MADSRTDFPDIDSNEFEKFITEQRELAVLLNKNKSSAKPASIVPGLFSQPVSPTHGSLIDDANKLLTILERYVRTSTDTLVVERHEMNMSAQRFHAAGIMVENAIICYMTRHTCGMSLSDQLKIRCIPSVDKMKMLGINIDEFATTPVSKIPFAEIMSYLKSMFIDLLSGWQPVSDNSSLMSHVYASNKEKHDKYYELQVVVYACKQVLPRFQPVVREKGMALTIDADSLAIAKSLLFTAEAPKPKLGM